LIMYHHLTSSATEGGCVVRLNLRWLWRQTSK